MGLFRRQKALRLTPEGYLVPDDPRRVRHLPPTAYFYRVQLTPSPDQNVHLRENRQAILAANGIDQKTAKEYRTEAILVREPFNEFDSDAVAVVINSRCIGYLGFNFAREIEYLAERGEILVVDACLSWDDQNVISATVRVDLIH